MLSSGPWVRFDYLFTVLAAWPVVGLFLDGWAHTHLTSLDSFFTPWHGVLYSGFLVTAAALVIASVRAGRIPAGYGWALAGLGVFLAAGAGDMAWHLLFGVEVGVDAFLSPTHLLLATGFVLIMSGPMRAAPTRREDPTRQGWRDLAPALVAATLGYSVLTFFTSYAHPFVNSYAFSSYPDIAVAHPHLIQVLVIPGILLQSGILTAVVVTIVRRWRPPFGAIAMLLGVNATLLSVLHDEYRLIPAALLAGLVADVVGHRSGRRGTPLPLGLVCALLPGTLYLLYFLTLAGTGGAWWSVHVWTGSVVLAALVGLGVASLAGRGQEVEIESLTPAGELPLDGR